MRMRRVYLYSVALISILALLFGLLKASANLVNLWLASESPAITLSALANGTVWPWLALAVVAGGAWGFHWYLADRVAHTLTIAGGAERSSVARKAYLYVGQFGALVALAAESIQLVYNLALAALGETAARLAPWPARPVSAAIGTAIALAFWVYLRYITVHDDDMGHEAGAGVAWRRGYYYLAIFLATLLAAAGAGEFLRTFLRVAGQIYFFGLNPADAAIWRQMVAISLGAVAFGLPASVFLLYMANRLATADETADELNALDRKLIIYTGMIAGAAVTLISLGYLLWQGLQILAGQPIAGVQTLWENAISMPLAYLPVGAIIWIVFGNMARNDIAWGPESRDAAVLRRLYYYLMAALGLAAFWYGLQALLVLVLLLVSGVWSPALLATTRAREYFSLAGALAIVGAPAWWAHWSVQQRLARESGPLGYVERTSILRRVYLYGIVAASIAVAVGTLAVVLYQAPGWLFGPKSAGSFVQSLVELGVAVATALAWWITHGFVMRGDERLRLQDQQMAGIAARPAIPTATSRDTVILGYPDEAPLPAIDDATPVPSQGNGGAEEPEAVRDVRHSSVSYSRAAVGQLPLAAGREKPAATQPSPAASNELLGAVAVVDGDDGSVGASLLAALRRSLPDTTLWPVALNPTAHMAMLAALGGQPPAQMPPDAMSRVAVIVGPSDIMAPGGLSGQMPPELAAAMAASPARKILLPPRNQALRWVAAPDWPRERWIEYAVSEVTAALAGR